MTRSIAKNLNKQVMKYNKRFDADERFLSDNLNPARLGTLFRSYDQGNISDGLELWEDILAKDHRLQSVVNTRTDAISGLDWEIVSASQTTKQRQIDNVLADEAAAYVAEHLENLRGFRKTLTHFANGIPVNLAVSELLWENNELVDFYDVPSGRLNVNFQKNPEVRILTEEEPTRGVEAERYKFAIHIPRYRANPFKVVLAKPASILYMMKRFSLEQWSVFMEVFANPIRWANYPVDGSNPTIQDDLIDMLENMGADMYGAFPEGVKLEFVEAARGTTPHPESVNWAERQQSILILGQNLSTDTTGGTGTYSAAKTQENVRADLLLGDVQTESETVTQEIIRPMLDLRFPGKKVPYPIFRRILIEEDKRKKDAEVFDIALNKLGLMIDESVMYETLKIPQPETAGAPEPLDDSEDTEEEILNAFLNKPFGSDKAGNSPEMENTTE